MFKCTSFLVFFLLVVSTPLRADSCALTDAWLTLSVAMREHDARYDGCLQGEFLEGFDPTDLREETLAHIAARFNNVNGLRSLHEHGATLEARNFLGETPLRAAIKENSTDAALYLLNLATNVDDPDMSGRTLLFWAMGNKNAVIAKALLKRGCRTDTIYNEGESHFSALDYAKSKKLLEILPLLQEKKP